MGERSPKRSGSCLKKEVGEQTRLEDRDSRSQFPNKERGGSKVHREGVGVKRKSAIRITRLKKNKGVDTRRIRAKREKALESYRLPEKKKKGKSINREEWGGGESQQCQHNR